MVALVGENGAADYARQAPGKLRAHGGRILVAERPSPHPPHRVALTPGRRVPGFFSFELRPRPPRARRDTHDDSGGRRTVSAPGRRRRGRCRRPRDAARTPGPRVEVSFGQAEIALARGQGTSRWSGADEPTAALDAETSMPLERYAAAARAGTGRRGTEAEPELTVLVSHRSARCAWPTSSWCSTARASPRSAPTGPGGRGGPYAELYADQAAPIDEPQTGARQAALTRSGVTALRTRAAWRRRRRCRSPRRRREDVPRPRRRARGWSINTLSITGAACSREARRSAR